MDSTPFVRHCLPARKDLLDFVEKELDKQVREKLGKCPVPWIDELNIINLMLTREPLVRGKGIHQPPVGKPNFAQLGPTVYHYTGPEIVLRGLWVQGERQWAHLQIGGVATLSLHPDFDCNNQMFLPENFERSSTEVKVNKRPIRKFDACGKTVYAKGSVVSPTKMYTPPSYRLTSLARVDKVTSEEEVHRTFELETAGIAVSPVIGYYKALAEEYAFFGEVKGKNPKDCFDQRDTIIDQDAQMLATLCRLGYHKQGFTSWDDKVFDGRRLYLVDVEEIDDLYFPLATDFRKVLLDPKDNASVKSFRKQQKNHFLQLAKDAIFNYRSDLLPGEDQQIQYLHAFCKELGWTLSAGEKKSILKYPQNYCTLDSHIAMMLDG